VSFVAPAFVVFFALFLAGFALMPTRTARQAFLLVANVVFYGSGTPWFLCVLLVPSLVDYACALRIEASSDDATRKQWLVLSLVVNLGILSYFKYANFFGETIASLFHVTAAPLYIVLPIGISFFTFKTMSYTIDVYRRELTACRSLWRYAMFVSFFPELVAGPIVRASVFLPQMERPLGLSWSRSWSGLQLILLGLTKKLLVADRLAILSDTVFGQPQLFSQMTVLSAIVAYSLQIYCDFSGYSDMAIGIARIIGFDLPENFNMPYLATSITAFWRRWHITLSEWLRDYLYIPLGGNRRGKTRMYVNLAVTMLLGGLWHGARWTFVVWGALHGLGLALHKWRRTRSRVAESRSPLRVVGSWALTYAFVCAAWVFFRSPDFATAALVLRKAAGLAPGGATWVYAPLYVLSALIVAAHVIGAAWARRESTQERTSQGRDASIAGLVPLFPRIGFASAFALTIVLVVVYLFTPLQRSPFIYFQF
jgi:alginate O-acetyltransferase complex protein AlgI